MVIYMTTPILPHNHGDIHNVLEAMPSKDTCADMASAFKQLCDGTRLQIFWLLCHSEECVLNISAAVGMSAPAVSHDLRTPLTSIYGQDLRFNETKLDERSD